MSTNDVPGFNASNGDTLKMGCWAESTRANDESLIFVQSVENGRVIFSIFDLTKKPVLEYRDAMPEPDFKSFFSWQAGVTKPGGEWTWHDKTRFPWEKVIKGGAQDGLKYASAEDQISAAEEVKQHLKMRAEKVDLDKAKARSERIEPGRHSAEAILAKIGRALDSAIGTGRPRDGDMG